MNQSNQIDPLTQLAIRHGTDKWGPHFYTPIYHTLFSGLRDRPLRLLEIGVGGYGIKTLGGASLAMWVDYFPHGQITGIDNAEKRLSLDPRVKLYRGSQDDPAFLQQVCAERGPFDIVVDDGSHVPAQVVASFQILFPALADGALYVIEDVQTAFWSNFGGTLQPDGDILTLARTIIESLNHAEIAVADPARSFTPYARHIKSLRAFHNLLVIEKGDNSEPSNFAYDLENAYAAHALQTMQQQLERSPTADGLANLAELFLRSKDPVKAQEIADKALSLAPTNMAALMAACSAARHRGDVPALINYLERVLKNEPDNAPLQQELEQARSQIENSDKTAAANPS